MPKIFVASKNAIVVFLALGLSVFCSAHALAEDDSPDKLFQRIEELDQQGKYQEAIPLAEKLVALARQAQPPDDRETAGLIDLLAHLYEYAGEYAKAEPLFIEALRIRQKIFGRSHRITATSLNNLGLLYSHMGSYAKAEPLLKEALDIFQKTLGSEAPNTLISLNNLGLL